MKCTKENCNNQAKYVVDGNSVCKDHAGKGKDDKPSEGKEGQTMGEVISGTVGDSQKF